jgi:hypothetical protein
MICFAAILNFTTDRTGAVMTTDLEMRDARGVPEAPSALRGPALFTWAAWGVSLAVALVYVATFAKNVPIMDEWDFIVPFLTGDRGLTFEYLWAQHNEHRIVLTKLVELCLIRLGGGDFRVGMYFNVAVCAAFAAALVAAARRLRGRSSYQDAIFPLLLLQVGHWETFLRGDTVGNVLGTALACTVLLIILRGNAAASPRRAALVGASLLLLPFCGAHGLCLVPGFSLWLAQAGVADLRDGSRRGRLAALIELGTVLCIFVIFYLYSIGYRSPPHHPAHRGLRSVMRAGLEFLTAALGMTAISTWPYSGAAVLLTLLLAAGVLSIAAWRRPGERRRALGLLLYLGAFATLAFAVGWGRSGFGPFAGIQSRYAMLAVPALCGAFFAWELYAPRGFAGLAGAVICTSACMLYVPNLQGAWSFGAVQRANARAFLADVDAGMPAQKLAQRPYAASIYPDRNRLAAKLRDLRSRDINQFRRAHNTPIVPLSIEPPPQDLPGSDGAGRATGQDSHVVFCFRRPQYAWRIRLTCTYKGRMDTPAVLQASWRLTGRGESTDRHRTFMTTIAENEKQIILPIDDVIDCLRIDSDVRPRDFRISRLELLREPDSDLSVTILR